MFSVHSNNKKDAGPRVSRGECVDCDNYKRKIKESEQSLSDRDVLIAMLQKEIRKMEDLYKQSIDDYEKLRFSHCTAVQELSNLKEIQKKYEKDYDSYMKEKCCSRKELEKLPNETDTWQNQRYTSKQKLISTQFESYYHNLASELKPTEDDNRYRSLENKLQPTQNGSHCCNRENKLSPLQDKEYKATEANEIYAKTSASSLAKNIFKDVSNIEHVIQDQRETFKDLYSTFFTDKTSVNHSKQDTPLTTRAGVDNNGQYTPIIGNMHKQMQELNEHVSKLKTDLTTIGDDINPPGARSTGLQSENLMPTQNETYAKKSAKSLAKNLFKDVSSMEHIIQNQNEMLKSLSSKILIGETSNNEYSNVFKQDIPYASTPRTGIVKNNDQNKYVIENMNGQIVQIINPEEAKSLDLQNENRQRNKETKSVQMQEADDGNFVDNLMPVNNEACVKRPPKSLTRNLFKDLSSIEDIIQNQNETLKSLISSRRTDTDKNDYQYTPIVNNMARKIQELNRCISRLKTDLRTVVEDTGTEEASPRDPQNENRQRDLEDNSNLVVNLQLAQNESHVRQTARALVEDIFKDVSNIEHVIQNQNETLKSLSSKILIDQTPENDNEYSKVFKQGVPQASTPRTVTDKIDDQYKPVVNNMARQIQELNRCIGKLKTDLRTIVEDTGSEEAISPDPQNENRQRDLEDNSNLVDNLQPTQNEPHVKKTARALAKDIFKDVSNIEHVIQNQNETLKSLSSKILIDQTPENDTEYSKVFKQGAPQASTPRTATDKNDDQYKPIVNNMARQIQDLNRCIAKLKTDLRTIVEDTGSEEAILPDPQNEGHHLDMETNSVPIHDTDYSNFVNNLRPLPKETNVRRSARALAKNIFEDVSRIEHVIQGQSETLENLCSNRLADETPVNYDNEYSKVFKQGVPQASTPRTVTDKNDDQYKPIVTNMARQIQDLNRRISKLKTDLKTIVEDTGSEEARSRDLQTEDRHLDMEINSVPIYDTDYSNFVDDLRPLPKETNVKKSARALAKNIFEDISRIEHVVQSQSEILENLYSHRLADETPVNYDNEYSKVFKQGVPQASTPRTVTDKNDDQYKPIITNMARQIQELNRCISKLKTDLKTIVEDTDTEKAISGNLQTEDRHLDMETNSVPIHDTDYSNFVDHLRPLPKETNIKKSASALAKNIFEDISRIEHVVQGQSETLENLCSNRLADETPVNYDNEYSRIFKQGVPQASTPRTVTDKNDDQYTPVVNNMARQIQELNRCISKLKTDLKTIVEDTGSEEAKSRDLQTEDRHLNIETNSVPIHDTDYSNFVDNLRPLPKETNIKRSARALAKDIFENVSRIEHVVQGQSETLENLCSNRLADETPVNYDNEYSKVFKQGVPQASTPRTVTDRNDDQYKPVINNMARQIQELNRCISKLKTDLKTIVEDTGSEEAKSRDLQTEDRHLNIETNSVPIHDTDYSNFVDNLRPLPKETNIKRSARALAKDIFENVSRIEHVVQGQSETLENLCSNRLADETPVNYDNEYSKVFKQGVPQASTPRTVTDRNDDQYKPVINNMARQIQELNRCISKLKTDLKTIVEDTDTEEAISRNIQNENRHVDMETNSVPIHDTDYNNFVDNLRPLPKETNVKRSAKALAKNIFEDVSRIEHVIQNQTDILNTQIFNQAVAKASTPRTVTGRTDDQYEPIVENMAKQIQDLNGCIAKLKTDLRTIVEETSSEEAISRDSQNKSLPKNIFKDVSNIEHVIQNQNETLKTLSSKFLPDETSNNEYTNVFKQGMPQASTPRTGVDKNNDQYIPIIDNMNRQIEELNRYISKLKTELAAVVEDTNSKVAKSRDLVQQLTQDNDTIKNQLTEKSAALTSCLGILEQNRGDINKLSVTVENIMNEKEHYLQDLRRLKQIIKENETQFKNNDQQICDLKCKLNAIRQEQNTQSQKEKLELQEELKKCRQHTEQLRNEFAEKEKCLCCQKDKLEEQLKQTEENNKILGDTLTIITNENKCNLNKITALSTELKEVNKEFEQSENNLKMYITELEKQMEEQKDKVSSSEQTQKFVDSERSNLVEENKRLSTQVSSLEKALEVATLENTEYEEENRSFSQKLNKSCSAMDKLKKEYETVKNQKENEIKQLKNEINRLKSQDCKAENEELKKKIIIIEDELQKARQEKTKTDDENKNLHDKVEELHYCCSNESKKLKDKMSLIQEELNKAQEERAKIDNDYENLHDHMKKLRQQCSDYGKGNEEIKQKIELLTEELKRTHEEKLRIDDENKNLKNRMEKLQESGSMNEELKTKLDTLNEQLKAACEEKEKASNENNILKGQLGDLRKQCTECSNLNAQIEEMQQNLLNCDNKNKEMEQRIKTLEEDLKTAREENETIGNKNKTLTSQLEDCKSEHQKVKKQIDMLNEELKLAYKEKTNIDNDNKILKTQTEELQKQISTYNSSNSEAEKMNKLTEKENATNKEKDAVEDKNKSLSSQLEECKVECQKMKNEVHRLNRELKRAREQTITIDNYNENLKTQTKKQNQKFSDYGKENGEIKERIGEELTTAHEEKEQSENKNKALQSQSEGPQKQCPNCCKHQKTKNDTKEEKLIAVNKNKNQKTQTKGMEQTSSNYDRESEEMRSKIDTLSGKLKTAYEEKAEMENKNKILNSQLKDIRQRCTECSNNAREELKKMVDMLNKELKTLHDEKARLGDENKNLKKQIEEMQHNSCNDDNKTKEMEQKICMLSEELKTVYEKKEGIENENKFLSSQLEDVKRLCVHCKNKENREIQKDDNINEELKTATEEKAKLDDENKNLKTQIEEMQKQSSNCAEKIKEMELKINILNEELNNVHDENIKTESKNKLLNTQLEDLRKHCTECSNGRQDMKKEVDGLNQKLKTALEEKVKADNENKNLKIQIEDMQRNLSNQSRETEDKINTLNEQLRIAHEERAVVEDNNKTISNQIEEAKKQCNECFNNKSQEMKKLIDTLNKELTTAREEKTKADNEIKNLNLQIEEVKHLCTKSGELEEKINTLREQLEATNEEKVTLENKNTTLSNQLEELRKHCTDCNNSHQGIKEEVDRLNKKLKTADEEKEKIDKENQNLKAQIEEMRQNSPNCESEIKEMEEKINALREELKTIREEKTMIENKYKIVSNQLEEFEQKPCTECNNKHQEMKKVDDMANKEIQPDDNKEKADNKNIIIHDNEIEEMKKKMDMLNTALQAASEEKEKLDSENKTLRNQLENLQQRYSDSNNGNDKLEKKSEMVKERLKNLTYEDENENNNINSQTQGVRGNFSEYKEENEADEKTDPLKETIPQEKSKVDKNKSPKKRKSLKSQLEEYQQSCSDCSKENEEMKEKIKAMNEELKRAYEEKVNLESENKHLKDQINGLQKELLETCKETQSKALLLEDKIDKLEKEQKDKSDQLSGCCSQMDDIKRIISNQQIVNSKYLSQIHELEARENLLEQQKINLNDEKQQLLKEVKLLKDKLNEYEKSIQDYEDAKSLNQKLQKEIDGVDVEICRRECMISHLEQCLDRSNQTLEECDKQMKGLQKEVKNFKSENEELKKQLQKYVYESEVKKAEAISLQEKLNITKKQQFHVETAKNKPKDPEDKSNNLENLTDLTKKYNELVETNKEKDEELGKLRQQLETLQKSSETTRLEYQKIKKAYKELKVLLDQQITNYKAGFEVAKEDSADIATCCRSENMPKPHTDKCLDELQKKILEQEKEVKITQHKNKDLCCEISRLKDSMHKVISDNKILRKTINELLTTLEEKLKHLSDSGEDVSHCCASLLANTILHSLSDLEKQVVRSNKNAVTDKCSCMSEIMSTYSINRGDQTLPKSGSSGIKCIKYQNKNFGSSSEVLNIPAEFLEDQGTKSNDPDNDCCKDGTCGPSGMLSQETHDDKEDKTVDPQTETFIIEPGHSHHSVASS